MVIQQESGGVEPTYWWIESEFAHAATAENSAMVTGSLDPSKRAPVRPALLRRPHLQGPQESTGAF